MATVAELDVKTLVDITPGKMSEIKADRFRSTLKYVVFDALLNTLNHNLAELQVKKHANKL